MENLVRFLVVFVENLLVKFQKMLNLADWAKWMGGGGGIGVKRE
jgi:hypothetical protein